MELLGTYSGEVIATNDPDKIGRIKVRVPHVYGPVEGNFGSIADADIPWALQAGLPSGHSNGAKGSGGISWLPVKGDHVWVRFLDGEPEKPVWEWGNQYTNDPTAFPLNTYAKQKAAATPSPQRTITAEAPNPDPIARAALTRYGHILEIIPTQVLLSTAGAYSITLVDKSPFIPGATGGGFAPVPDGYISLRTFLGNNIEMYDDQNLIWINSLDMFMANFAELSFNGAVHFHAASASWQVNSKVLAYMYAANYFGEDSLFSAIMGQNTMVSARNTLWLTANILIEMMSASVVQIGAKDNVSISSKSTTVGASSTLYLSAMTGMLSADAAQMSLYAISTMLLDADVSLTMTSLGAIDMGTTNLNMHAYATAQLTAPYISLQTSPTLAGSSYVMVQPAAINISCGGRILNINAGGFFFL